MLSPVMGSRSGLQARAGPLRLGPGPWLNIAEATPEARLPSTVVRASVSMLHLASSEARQSSARNCMEKFIPERQAPQQQQPEQQSLRHEPTV